jgi:uncharacterized protein YciI
MRFAYVYSMKREPGPVRAVIPDHVKYWNDLGLGGYLGGPFDDRSGGLITFECESLEAAERVTGADPFAREGLLESRAVKRWLVD